VPDECFVGIQRTRDPADVLRIGKAFATLDPGYLRLTHLDGDGELRPG
jgi:hypothetical protein